jgi:hypothetical protein
MVSFRVFIVLIGGLAIATAARPNSLSEREKAAGWELVFDGVSLTNWQTPKGLPVPEDRWKISGGWLQCLGKGGGDIISTAAYEQFELTWEWKLENGGNSGVKYFVNLARGPIGHEYQLLDDATHPDGKLAEGKRLTAAFYDVFKCERPSTLKPPMEINRSKILIQGNHVEHWLNGKKLLSYELGAEGTSKAVALSKFQKTRDFGTRLRGHILLQDHMSLVWFRNIKIREIKP